MTGAIPCPIAWEELPRELRNDAHSCVITGFPFNAGPPAKTENGMLYTQKITCSVREAQELTGLGKTTLYSLLSENKITSTRVGTKRLIHVDSLRRFLEAA